jgi:prefoldin subunit 5
MTQEEVKKQLLKLYDAEQEYGVVFSGKKSNAVNGLYKPDKKEILIHNKNFANDNLLIYTAIHELAHHICMTEKGQRGARSHTALFWSTFHDLLDIAEQKGIYTRKHNERLEGLIKKARELDQKIAELQRELGKILMEIREACEESGTRTEDVYERDVKLSRKTWTYSIKAANVCADGDCGQDIQKLLAGNRNGDMRAVIAGRSREQKSVVQIQQGLSNEKKKSNTALERLIVEKNRIEKTIASLQGRLLQITAEIEKEDGEEVLMKKTADRNNAGN